MHENLAPSRAPFCTIWCSRIMSAKSTTPIRSVRSSGRTKANSTSTAPRWSRAAKLWGRLIAHQCLAFKVSDRERTEHRECDQLILRHDLHSRIMIGSNDHVLVESGDAGLPNL